jgi:hypothetical protein
MHLKEHYGLGGLTSVDLVARLSELIGPNDGQYSQVIHVVDESVSYHCLLTFCSTRTRALTSL